MFAFFSYAHPSYIYLIKKTQQKLFNLNIFYSCDGKRILILICKIYSCRMHQIDQKWYILEWFLSVNFLIFSEYWFLKLIIHLTLTSSLYIACDWNFQDHNNHLYFSLEVLKHVSDWNILATISKTFMQMQKSPNIFASTRYLLREILNPQRSWYLMPKHCIIQLK